MAGAGRARGRPGAAPGEGPRALPGVPASGGRARAPRAPGGGSPAAAAACPASPRPGSRSFPPDSARRPGARGSGFRPGPCLWPRRLVRPPPRGGQGSGAGGSAEGGSGSWADPGPGRGGAASAPSASRRPGRCWLPPGRLGRRGVRPRWRGSRGLSLPRTPKRLPDLRSPPPAPLRFPRVRLPSCLSTFALAGALSPCGYICSFALSAPNSENSARG